MQVKKRTQKDGEQDAGKKSGPKSFVFCRGKHAVSAAALNLFVQASALMPGAQQTSNIYGTPCLTSPV